MEKVCGYSRKPEELLPSVAVALGTTKRLGIK